MATQPHQSATDPATVLGQAVMLAADRLGVSETTLARIIGIDLVSIIDFDRRFRRSRTNVDSLQEFRVSRGARELDGTPQGIVDVVGYLDEHHGRTPA